MPFKVYVRSEVAAGLDEPHRIEAWERDYPGPAYHRYHCEAIEAHETCVPTLRRVLAGTPRRILDSGCGTGRWLAYLRNLGHDVYGIDDSAAPLAVAHAHDPTLRLVRGDARRCPFPDASFDVVFSSYVAEHCEEGPREFLAEARRLLRPGGLLLLVVPYCNWLRRLFTHRVLQAFYGLSWLRGRPLVFTELHFSRREVERLLVAGGFSVEHAEPDDHLPPLAKGLSVDLGRLVLPRADSWEMNRFGRVLASVLGRVSPWFACSGVFYVARATKTTSPQTSQGKRRAT